jgi:L-rhamnose-H+ transport protein
MRGSFQAGAREWVLFGGVGAFLAGVTLCGKAGRIRDGSLAAEGCMAGYLFAVASGIISAIFNIGYTLALPISAAGVQLGYSPFASTNCIWLLMLGAGAIPNVLYCSSMARKHGSGKLFFAQRSARPWLLSAVMGLLWGGSIFLYGAATPRLGDLGPSVGWPLSLAAGLLVANLMGVWLGEWTGTAKRAVAFMRLGIALIFFAIVLCSLSARIGA